MHTAFSATYKCLFGASPHMADFGQGDVHMCHNRGFSCFISTQPERIYWAVFVRTERETRWPTRVRYSDADMQETAARVMGIPVTTTVLFGELWDSRIKAGLVPLEEGVLDTWHSGRIVLVGDAIHKVLFFPPKPSVAARKSILTEGKDDTRHWPRGRLCN